MEQFYSNVDGSVSEQNPSPLDKMRSAIQLAGFHYLVCLKARPTNEDHGLKFENAEYVFESIRKSSSHILHAEFQRWAAMAVLRDLVENFSVFLTEIYHGATRANPSAGYSVSVAQFERKGIEDQLAVLSNDFSIDEAWTSRLIGYNRARNCLAHRLGIVGVRDATDGTDLVVRWLASKIEVIDGPISSAVEVVGPMGTLVRASHIHGKPARAELQDKERRIAVGSVLSFFPTDILEICQTFQMAAAAFSTLSLQS